MVNLKLFCVINRILSLASVSECFYPPKPQLTKLERIVAYFYSFFREEAPPPPTPLEVYWNTFLSIVTGPRTEPLYPREITPTERFYIAVSSYLDAGITQSKIVILLLMSILLMVCVVVYLHRDLCPSARNRKPTSQSNMECDQLIAVTADGVKTFVTSQTLNKVKRFERDVVCTTWHQPSAYPHERTASTSPHEVKYLARRHEATCPNSSHGVNYLTSPYERKRLTQPQEAKPLVNPCEMKLLANPHGMKYSTSPHQVKSLVNSHKGKCVTSLHGVKCSISSQERKHLANSHDVKPSTSPHGVEPSAKPHEVKPSTNPHKRKCLTSLHGVKYSISPQEGKRLANPHGVKPSTNPHGVKPLVDPHEVEPLVNPHEVKSLTRPNEDKPSTIPHEVKCPTSPFEVNCPTCTHVGKHPIDPREVKHAISQYEVEYSTSPCVVKGLANKHEMERLSSQHQVERFTDQHEMERLTSYTQEVKSSTSAHRSMSWPSSTILLDSSSSESLSTFDFEFDVESGNDETLDSSLLSFEDNERRIEAELNGDELDDEEQEAYYWDYSCLGLNDYKTQIAPEMENKSISVDDYTPVVEVSNQRPYPSGIKYQTPIASKERDQIPFASGDVAVQSPTANKPTSPIMRSQIPVWSYSARSPVRNSGRFHKTNTGATSIANRIVQNQGAIVSRIATTRYTMANRIVTTGFTVANRIVTTQGSEDASPARHRPDNCYNQVNRLGVSKSLEMSHLPNTRCS